MKGATSKSEGQKRRRAGAERGHRHRQPLRAADRSSGEADFPLEWGKQRKAGPANRGVFNHTVLEQPNPTDRDALLVPSLGLRGRGTIGQPTVTGAISAALGGLKAAIGEVLLRRVAERPSALDLADLREPDPPHLTHLSRGENPYVGTSLFTRNGRSATSRGRNCPSPRDCRGQRPFWPLPFPDRSRPRSPPGNLRRRRPFRAQSRMRPAVKLDPDPTGLSDHRVARRSAERRGDPGRAPPLERQFPECLDSLIRPHSRSPRVVKLC